MSCHPLTLFLKRTMEAMKGGRNIAIWSVIIIGSLMLANNSRTYFRGSTTENQVQVLKKIIRDTKGMTDEVEYLPSESILSDRKTIANPYPESIYYSCEPSILAINPYRLPLLYDLPPPERM